MAQEYDGPYDHEFVDPPSRREKRHIPDDERRISLLGEIFVGQLDTLEQSGALAYFQVLAAHFTAQGNENALGVGFLTRVPLRSSDKVILRKRIPNILNVTDVLTEEAKEVHRNRTRLSLYCSIQGPEEQEDLETRGNVTVFYVDALDTGGLALSGYYYLNGEVHLPEESGMVLSGEWEENEDIVEEKFKALFGLDPLSY